MYQFSAQSAWNTSRNRAHKFIRQKIASCINLQLPILFFENITLSDMNHRRTYMHINFQQNWVSRSVKTVHTNLFAQYRKLHKFATTNSNFEENQSFRTCSIIKHTCISIFSKIGLKHKSWPCLQVYSQKNRKLHKFATTNNNFQKSTISDMHHR